MHQASLLGGIDGGRWVSVSDAARLEAEAGRAVNKSSISRFLDRNPDVPVRRDNAGRVREVEYGALANARASSLSVQDSRALAPTSAPVAVPSSAAQGGSRKRALEEEKLELDLAERKGELLSRMAVAMAWETAGVAFVQALERRRRKLVSEIAGMSDLRAAEIAMKTADRKLLEQLAKELGAMASDTVAAEEPLAA